METNFNFKSQPATSIKQSEKLLALGLKKETADCHYPISMLDGQLCDCIRIGNPSEQKYHAFPAWSLGRLIEMLSGIIYPKEELPSFSDCAYLNLGKTAVWYDYIDYDANNRTLIRWGGNSLFCVVNCIEWLIKEGYFNKEYLICQKEIKKATEYQYQYTDNIEKQEFFKNGMVIDAELVNANPAWIRCVDEMPPIGINVLTRVIKGDGTIIFQVDKRTEFEWVNLCHYDKVSHWMKINFLEE